jgi:ABC-type multidrug transport system ATPase subunit
MEDQVRSPVKKPEHRRVASAASSTPSFASTDHATSELDSSTPGKKKWQRVRESVLRGGDGSRNNHLHLLVSQRIARQRYLSKLLKRPGGSTIAEDASKLGRDLQEDELAKSEDRFTSETMSAPEMEVQLTEEEKEAMRQASAPLKLVKKLLEDYKDATLEFPIEIRVENLTYSAPITPSVSRINTVYNSSVLYQVVKFFKEFGKGTASQEKVTKVILDNISLSLQPGKMYLVLGPPASGKSSLLKAIAGRLSQKNGEEVEGSVSYNGKTFEDRTTFHIGNAIAFIDQLDRHAPRLTVEETFEFAFQCKRGGRHLDVANSENTAELRRLAAKADSERLVVNMNLSVLGLDHVKDTFVGDDDIRGVSGGQRRRVTVGEMLMGASPILCGDEISNGLDATSTFEMIQTFTLLAKDVKRLRVISLLQPSPETVSLFNEIILLSEGKLLYAGPISLVEDYFASLGYKAPMHMDVADFLQLLSTPDAVNLFEPPPDLAETRSTPYSADELAEFFRKSTHAERISEDLKAPFKHVWSSSHKDVEQHEEVNHLDDRRFRSKYANSFPRSVRLNLNRNLTIWIRDRRVLIANAVKNIIMGASVGGVFFQTDDVVSILGVLFQGMLFIMLGKNEL